MSLNGNWGTTAGDGTVGDPYQVEDEADWNAIEASDLSDGSSHFIINNDITFSSSPSRMVFYGDLNLNGFTLDGITAFYLGTMISTFYGNIYDGEFNFNVTTNNGGDESFINTLENSGSLDSVRFTGTITTSGTGRASIIDTLRSSGVSNCIFDVTLQSVDGPATPIRGGTTETITKCIGLGVVTSSGTGIASPFTQDTSITATDCFYNSTVNGTVAGDKATPKTTAELQTLTTYTDATYSIAALNTYNGETWAIDDGNAYPVLAFEVEPASFASGTVKFNDVNFSNGVVDFFSAPYTAQGSITKVEQVPINSGVATMTVERDPLLDYFGIARGMTQDFTGTLASAPAGDVISTGLDLTGVSIGGANDDHYIFRATGGTGAGTEVTVIDRSGGDIIVKDASAFATGTEFTLGRFVRGVSRVFPKD